MRISDWSSDVCSSDLRIPVDVVIHEEIAVLKVLAFGNAVRADEKVNLALARHFLRPLLGAGRKGAQDRTHIRAKAGQAGFVRAGAADPGRSEEHTLELQSLMRNSYAVFSLTKQIYNRDQDKI